MDRTLKTGPFVGPDIVTQAVDHWMDRIEERHPEFSFSSLEAHEIGELYDVVRDLVNRATNPNEGLQPASVIIPRIIALDGIAARSL